MTRTCVAKIRFESPLSSRECSQELALLHSRGRVVSARQVVDLAG